MATKWVGAVALAVLLLPVGPACAQDSTARGRAILKGVVMDSGGRSVFNATIAVHGRQAQTDSVGAFQLSALPAGTTTLAVRRVGYLPATVGVALVDGDTVTTRVTLTRIVSLDSVNVVAPAGIAEFEERRATKAGHYITRSDLAKHPTWSMGEALSRVPGLKIEFSRTTSEAFAVNSRTTRNFSNAQCHSLIYVDNALVYGGTGPPFFNLNTLNPNEIAGVEYYSGGASTPSKYNKTGGGCGVLVIWTRR